MRLRIPPGGLRWGRDEAARADSSWVAGTVVDLDSLGVAPVHRMIQLSTVDGPGARTTVFLQGCNIRCLYCHNPETQAICCHCGECVAGCPSGALAQTSAGAVTWEESRCIQCDRCHAVCPYHASPKVYLYSVQALFEAVSPNFAFVRGVTASGGEATLYPAFLTAFFKQVRAAGKTCLIDANGTVDLARYPELLAVTDGVMLDLKAWDPTVFEQLVGRRSTGHLQKNLLTLAQRQLIEELRLVYLPGRVDGRACLEGVARLLGDQVKTILLKLIRFRCHGVRGVLEQTPSPSLEEMQALEAFARSLGFERIVIR